MKKKFRTRRPSPTLIVAMVALVAALGGSAVAAKGPKVKFGQLSQAAKIQTVGTGPLTYASTQVSIPTTPPTGANVAALCPAGTSPVGGGIRVNDSDTFVNDSHPIIGGWGGTVFNNATVPRLVVTYAICAKSMTVTGALPTSS